MRKESSKVQNIYAALIAAFVLNFVPSFLVQVIASLVFMGVFISLYVFRRLAEKESLIDNHMTYLIRSVWIGGLFVILGTIVSAFYFIGSIGFDEYARLGQKAIEQGDSMAFPDVFHSAYPDEVFISVAITFAPGTIYLAFRLAKGLSRAIKGYRIANPTAWF